MSLKRPQLSGILQIICNYKEIKRPLIRSATASLFNKKKERRFYSSINMSLCVFCKCSTFNLGSFKKDDSIYPVTWLISRQTVNTLLSGLHRSRSHFHQTLLLILTRFTNQDKHRACETCTFICNLRAQRSFVRRGVVCETGPALAVRHSSPLRSWLTESARVAIYGPPGLMFVAEKSMHPKVQTLSPHDGPHISMMPHDSFPHRER